MSAVATAYARFDLGSWIQTERGRVEEALADLDGDLDTLPPPLASAVRYALEAGGKRLRPLLTVAAFRAAAGSDDAPPALYRLGCAVELIHSYSLVHDDLPVMDDDDLRRGRPTLHRKSDVATATVAGFLLIPLAGAVAARAAADLDLPASTRTQIVRELAAGAGAAGMVGGQWLDLAAEGRDLSVEELETIHRRKTAALISCAARMGALAAQADGAAVEELGHYGVHLGLAFQIADDLLDVTGDAARTGKTGGRDAALGKATYPAAMGMHSARERALGEAHYASRILINAGLDTPALIALARYAVERSR